MKFVKKSGIEYNFLERLSQRTFLDKYSRNFLVLPFHDLSINLSLIFAAKYRVKKRRKNCNARAVQRVARFRRNLPITIETAEKAIGKE